MNDIKLQFIPHMNTNSCCCFSSRTGCLIIGYFGAIMSSINAVGSLIKAVSTLSTNDSSMFMSIILSAVISMIQVYVHYSLIQGVEKQEPRKMYLWIYIHYIALIFCILLTGLIYIFLTEYFSDREEYRTSTYVILYLVCLLVIIQGIYWHFFAAVVTHCQDLILMKSYERIDTP